MTTAKVKCSICGKLLDHAHRLGEFENAEIEIKKKNDDRD